MHRLPWTGTRWAPLLPHLAQHARRGATALGDLLFARQCAFCWEPLEDSRPLLLCDGCRASFTAGEGVPRCPRCGQHTGPLSQDDGRCGHCRGVPLRFDSALPLGGYTGFLREAVLRLKLPGQEALARALGELLWQERGAALTALQVDRIVPVPMHWWRRWQRGVNCPELIAEVLARRLRVPVARRLLVRRRNTAPQADLLPTQRFSNVRSAFRLRRGYALRAARVLLVDDILTTGATASAAAGTLRRGGAATVQVTVLARAELP